MIFPKFPPLNSGCSLSKDAAYTQISVIKATCCLHFSQFLGNLYQGGGAAGCIGGTEGPRVSVVSQQH